VIHKKKKDRGGALGEGPLGGSLLAMCKREVTVKSAKVVGKGGSFLLITCLNGRFHKGEASLRFTAKRYAWLKRKKTFGENYEGRKCCSLERARHAKACGGRRKTPYLFVGGREVPVKRGKQFIHHNLFGKGREIEEVSGKFLARMGRVKKTGVALAAWSLLGEEKGGEVSNRR